MALRIEKVSNNPKMIALFWEGSLFRIVCKFLFLKEVEKIPEALNQEEFLSLFYQIEQRQGRRYAVALLSKRALLSFELVEKLESKGISKPAADQIVQLCTQRGYLDDTAQINRLIVKELKKGLSRKAIYFKLMQKKGLPSEVLHSWFQTQESSDEEALERWLLKHAKKIASASYSERMKIMQKLSRLGFSADLIRNKIILSE